MPKVRYLVLFEADVKQNAANDDELNEAEETDQQWKDEFGQVSAVWPVGVPQWHRFFRAWLLSRHLYTHRVSS